MTFLVLINLQRYHQLFCFNVQLGFSNDYPVHVCLFGVYVFVSVAGVQYRAGDFAMNDCVAVQCPICCSILLSHCQFSFCCDTTEYFPFVVDMTRLFSVTSAIRTLGSHLNVEISVPAVQSRL